MLGAGAGAACARGGDRLPGAGAVSWLCTWWRQVAGGGAGCRCGGAVSWLRRSCSSQSHVNRLWDSA